MRFPEKARLYIKKPSRLIPAFVVMLLIFIHSAMPADLSSEESGWFVDVFTRIFPFLTSTENLTFLIRKAAHFTEYLLLGLSLRWGIEKSLPALSVGILYAVSDEIHQHFVPGRSCEFRDICIDAAGVLAGVLMMKLLLRRRKMNQSEPGGEPGDGSSFQKRTGGEQGGGSSFQKRTGGE